MSNIDASDVYERIRILEAKVEYLAQHLGIETAAPAQAAMAAAIPPDVVALARAGDKIQAIKRYRELTNCDLREAKDVVESI